MKYILQLGRLLLLPVAILAISCLSASPATAQSYHVSLNTSQLTSGDNYGIDFQLNPGDSVGTTSSVSLGDFSFGGGSATPGTASDTPGATGDLSGPVVLDDSGGTQYPEFTQQFTPGSAFAFNIDASGLSAPSAGAYPDQFVFDIFDNTSGSSVPTNGPTGIELLTIENTGSGYDVEPYSYTGVDGNTYTTAAAPTPEQSTSLSMALLFGLAALGVGLKSRLTSRV